MLIGYCWQVAVTAVAMSFHKDQIQDSNKSGEDRTAMKGNCVCVCVCVCLR